jgi:hypothetical protein
MNLEIINVSAFFAGTTHKEWWGIKNPLLHNQSGIGPIAGGKGSSRKKEESSSTCSHIALRRSLPRTPTSCASLISLFFSVAVSKIDFPFYFVVSAPNWTLFRAMDNVDSRDGLRVNGDANTQTKADCKDKSDNSSESRKFTYCGDGKNLTATMFWVTSFQKTHHQNSV